jgi:hypothetical protein
MNPARRLSLCGLIILFLGCSSKPLRTFNENDPAKPDLAIKRISYRPLGSAQRTRTRAQTLQVQYEFQIRVENVGNAVFGEPFYISMTTQLEDYQTNQYSKHVLVNEGRALIQPGLQQTFIVGADIDYPPPPLPAFLPMRFYLNTEGLGTTTAFVIRNIAEHDYKNNVYEISLRRITR